MSLLTNLVAYYSLQGNSNDATGNGHTGSDTAISYSTSYGKISQGALLNGSSSVITIADNAALQFGTGDFTISMWVDFSSLPGAAGAFIFFSKASPLEIYAYNNGTNTIWSGGLPGDSTTAISATTWYFVTLTRISSAVVLYVNANSIKTATSSVSVSNSGTAISLGTRPSIDFFPGYIDEVGIWSRGLSSTEVTQLYNSGTGLAYSAFAPPASTGNFFAFF
jgi:hypothetical protein